MDSLSQLLSNDVQLNDLRSMGMHINVYAPGSVVVYERLFV